MANTITRSGHDLCLGGIDSDWTWNEAGSYPDKPGGIHIDSIKFCPASADEHLTIKTLNASGCTVFYHHSSNFTGDCTQYFAGKLLRPFLDYSGCSVRAESQLLVNGG